MNIVISDQGQVIGRFGADLQSVVHMEECAELIQAVSKMRRAAGADKSEELEDLIGEIADVLICIRQMQIMYDISDRDIQRKVDVKIRRQKERMHESARENS